MKQNKLIKIGVTVSGTLILLGIISYVVIGYINFESMGTFVGKIRGGLSLINTKSEQNQVENIQSSSYSKTLLEDSDYDGLTDKEEIKYKTDLNNPDTDKDGYLDGEEVKNGYNPNGNGKI